MSAVNDIAMELGTSNVTIYVRGHGIRLREPACVAIDRETRQVRAIGTEAHRMIGRTPANIQVIRPLANGELQDFDLTGTMIRYFVGKAVGKHVLARPRAVICLPSGVKEMERKALISVMFDAGVRRTQLVDKTVAAALGAGMRIEGSLAGMLADISAGNTDIAVLCNYEPVISSTLRPGGDGFDEAIAHYIRKKYNLLIGERTAEQVKMTLGSAVRRETDVEMEITGRNLISGMPKLQQIRASEIFESLTDTVSDLIEGLQAVLERTPAQLTTDVFNNGIVLTGGGALLYGLAEAVTASLSLPCQVAPDARDCAVLGLARLLEEPVLLRQLMKK